MKFSKTFVLFAVIVILMLALTACAEDIDRSAESNVPRTQQAVGSPFNPAGNAKVTVNGNTTTFEYSERDVNKDCVVTEKGWECHSR